MNQILYFLRLFRYIKNIEERDRDTLDHMGRFVGFSKENDDDNDDDDNDDDDNDNDDNDNNNIKNEKAKAVPTPGRSRAGGKASGRRGRRGWRRGRR